MKTIEQVLNDPPPGVDLTLVGGQALIYWTLSYRGSYPALFPDDVISSTYDVDFIVQFKEDCTRCAEHWGGRLVTPEPGDPTPEFGKIFIADEDGTEFQIDLLPDLLRIPKDAINRLRNSAADDASESPLKDFYVLSEWGTLLNRCYNTVSMAKYCSSEAIRQLHNAMQ